MSVSNICIVDYGMGNIGSITNAFEILGHSVDVSSDREVISSAHGLILPGVGAFPKAMNNLRDLQILDVIKDFAIEQEKPVLGICLGMQLLATSSEENGHHLGLGLIPGQVKKIPGNELPVPQVGWNDINLRHDSSIFEGILDNTDFYFVHSYYFSCERKFVSSTTNYGMDLTASIECKNVFGVQFHPERSHRYGLKVLENFHKLCSV